MYCNCKRDFSRCPSLVFPREITVSHDPETWHWSRVSTVSCCCSWKLYQWSSGGCTLKNSIAPGLVFIASEFTLHYDLQILRSRLCNLNLLASTMLLSLETLFVFYAIAEFKCAWMSTYVSLQSEVLEQRTTEKYKEWWSHWSRQTSQNSSSSFLSSFFQAFLILTFCQCRLRLMSSKPQTQCMIWWSTSEACELSGFQRPPHLEHLGTIIQIKWSSVNCLPRMSLQLCMNIHRKQILASSCWNCSLCYQSCSYNLSRLWLHLDSSSTQARLKLVVPNTSMPDFAHYISEDPTHKCVECILSRQKTGTTGKLFVRNSLNTMEHQLNEHKVGLSVNHLRFQLTNLESGSDHMCNQSQSFLPPFRSLRITDYISLLHDTTQDSFNQAGRN